jgi:cbb3-type cytochrome oxidase subunit 3
MEWWVILLLIVGIWIAYSAARSGQKSTEARQPEEPESDTTEDERASEYVDELLDTGKTDRRSTYGELSDEAWRRKQGQGSIEDRRGPGRF